MVANIRGTGLQRLQPVLVFQRSTLAQRSSANFTFGEFYRQSDEDNVACVFTTGCKPVLRRFLQRWVYL